MLFVETRFFQWPGVHFCCHQFGLFICLLVIFESGPHVSQVGLNDPEIDFSAYTTPSAGITGMKHASLCYVVLGIKSRTLYA